MVSDAVQRVREALRDHGAAGEVHTFTEPVTTAVAAAEQLGCPVGAIANSLVFSVAGRPILVLASGAHRVDTGRVAAHLGVSKNKVKRASPASVLGATGQEVGGVAPVGHPVTVPTVVDSALAAFDTVWAGAGDKHSMFPTSHDELVRMTDGAVLDVGRSPGSEQRERSEHLPTVPRNTEGGCASQRLGGVGDHATRRDAMISTREVTYDVDGLRMVGHLARPNGGGPWPAVLFAHDGIGLTDYQRGCADRLAEQGYLALAMDYHGGRVFTDPREMLDRALPLLADPGRLRAIGRAALGILLAEPGVDLERVAAVGYGGGGTLVLELGRGGADLRAIAAVHPAAPIPRPDESAAIRGAVLLGVGSEDPIVMSEQLLVFSRELQAAGIDWRLTIYGGAEHAFVLPPTNPDGTPDFTRTHHSGPVLPGVSYHPVQAQRAWRDVLDLLAETLSAPIPSAPTPSA